MLKFLKINNLKMNLCNNCGVELDSNVQICPLCGMTIGNVENTELSYKSEHYPSGILLLHRKENRKHIWELSGIIVFSAVVVCSIVNMVISKRLTWSLYANASVFAAWSCLTLVLLAFRKYFIIIPGLLFTLLTLLFLIDMFNPPVDWFFKVGLPFTLSFSGYISIIIILWKLAHLKGFNILGIAFVVLSGFCLVTEVIIDNYLYHSVSIRWSAIVAVSILPIALVLFFIHYRMKKGKRLDSYFHV